MIFFLTALFGMYVGRKLGWFLSKRVLYVAPFPLVFLLCIAWGVGIALGVHGLIRWLAPNIIIKIIMGFGAGAYVSIPNYGLFDQQFINDVLPRHTFISWVPLTTFIISSIAVAFLH